ncbi:MAG: outer membrane lipoprotein carrier protein LolA [Pseudomonadota bacterium]
MAAPAWADKIPLNDLARYINGIKSATSAFTQINEDGSIDTGTIFIKRPGRARFEYDPPNNSLVMAGGSTVAIFDPKSNVPPDQFPLKRTPLNLILVRNIDFNKSRMIVGHSEEGEATVVTAQDPENPQYGNIKLKFTGSPVQLRQWVITNEYGSQTTVIMQELKATASIPARKFSITQEMQARGLSD